MIALYVNSPAVTVITKLIAQQTPATIYKLSDHLSYHTVK